MKQCIVCLIIAFLLAISIAVPTHAQTAADSSRHTSDTNRNYDEALTSGPDYNYPGLAGL
jgi:hypothetical protein